MTLNEFGLLLRRRFPHLDTVPLNNADLAQYVLNLYPEYYDCISPTAKRIKQISNRIPASDAWFESSRVENVGMMIENNRKEALALHEADMLIKASSLGIPVTILQELAIEDQKHHHAMELERFRRDNGLEGGERARLTPHYLIRQLEMEVLSLIDRRDAESHPDKRDILNTRIRHLKGELDARGQQTLVQAGGGTGVEFTDQDADRDGVRGSSTEASVEPVPPEKPRVGF